MDTKVKKTYHINNIETVQKLDKIVRFNKFGQYLAQGVMQMRRKWAKFRKIGLIMLTIIQSEIDLLEFLQYQHTISCAKLLN